HMDCICALKLSNCSHSATIHFGGSGQSARGCVCQRYGSPVSGCTDGGRTSCLCFPSVADRSSNTQYEAHRCATVRMRRSRSVSPASLASLAARMAARCFSPVGSFLDGQLTFRYG